MHPLRHPRNAALAGIMFVVIGVLFWLVQAITGFRVDYAGVTMLIALGVATSIMAYVLVAGSSND